MSLRTACAMPPRVLATVLVAGMLCVLGCPGGEPLQLLDGGALEDEGTQQDAGTQHDAGTQVCVQGRWSTLAPYEESSAFYVTAVPRGEGLLALTLPPGGGARLLRTGPLLEPLDEGTPLHLEGAVSAFELVSTSEGPALVHDESRDGTTRRFLVPLDEDGRPLGLADGGIERSLVAAAPEQAVGVHAGPSADGTRVLVAFASGGAAFAPAEVVAAVTGPRGQVLAGPRVVLGPVAADGGTALFVRDVVGLPGGGFLLAAAEEPAFVGTEARIHLQRLAEDLEPVGSARVLQVSAGAEARLAAAPTAGGEPALAYREQVPDGGTALRMLRAVFDGGTPETWAEVPSPETFWFDLEGSDAGLRLAWKTHRFCPDCAGGGFLGRVFVRDEGTPARELSPAGQELQFSSSARPGIQLVRRSGSHMEVLLTVRESDGGVELQAVSDCGP